ncbi:hypothetical protein GGTG_08333 [Gaeumannomyces tritici R3-111a-1]|uniref:Uncharacterized protein n=1 Tax=Gaeumannomyces tritici (strain R3-111a-1) TaxID=644352 RepID=J3P497_GAET3|nr:hypothetical protein GGTG_08333 [Gaeumannomyces tritici R3-111a-1]EJT74493.1 hypothetical protein GGTG_08333 [Gaeumannomyces tritici R3-111a-1]
MAMSSAQRYEPKVRSQCPSQQLQKASPSVNFSEESSAWVMSRVLRFRAHVRSHSPPRQWERTHRHDFSRRPGGSPPDSRAIKTSAQVKSRRLSPKSTARESNEDGLTIGDSPKRTLGPSPRQPGNKDQPPRLRGVGLGDVEELTRTVTTTREGHGDRHTLDDKLTEAPRGVPRAARSIKTSRPG